MGALLAGAVVVAGGGGVIAATVPSKKTPPSAWEGMQRPKTASTQTAQAETPVSATTTTATTAAKKASAPKVKKVKNVRTTVRVASKKAAAKAPITYEVKRGDTLSGIADWFKLHGYGSLYAANKAVIGRNPNLIFPGQRITISGGVMTMAKSAR